jgi:hypothetical protein
MNSKTKQCPNCKRTLSIDNFIKRNTKKNESRVNCHSCRRRPVQRRAVLKKKYGITIEDYDLKLKEQNYCCAICLTSIPGGPTKNNYFMIDHCHKSEKVRGLLCHTCNFTLGNFQDSILRFQAAINYLQKYQ